MFKPKTRYLDGGLWLELGEPLLCLVIKAPVTILRDQLHANKPVMETVGCVRTPIDPELSASTSPHRDHSISDIHYWDPESTAYALQISIIPYLCHFRSVHSCHTDGDLGLSGKRHRYTRKFRGGAKSKSKYNRRIPNNDQSVQLSCLPRLLDRRTGVP
jgi:hypothetical protein